MKRNFCLDWFVTMFFIGQIEIKKKDIMCYGEKPCYKNFNPKTE